MEALTEKFFLSTNFKLPHTSESTNYQCTVEGQSLVNEAIQYMKNELLLVANDDNNKDNNNGDGRDDDDEQDFAVMLLVSNLDIHPWNSQKLVTEANLLYSKLFTRINGTRQSEFLSKSPLFCKRVNRLISKTLKRDLWQSHAAVYVLYKWYCTNLVFPLVSEHLDVLLPPSLLLVDSYVDALKVSGVECLLHIISESGKTELRWHGRAQVIFDALHKLSYTHHEPLISVLHPTLIKILRVLGRDSEVVCEQKVDSIYQRLLSDMYLEDKIVLRRTLTLSLKLYIEYMGADTIKHLKKTMKVVLNYLEDSCGPNEITRIMMLEVIELLIRYDSPRIQNYFQDVCKALLRLLLDTAMLSTPADITEVIISRITRIFNQMRKEGCTFISETLRKISRELPVQKDKQGVLIVERIERVLASLQH